MVYSKSNLIQTVDFNNFVGTPTGTPSSANKTLQPFISDAEAALRVAAIYGVGYGQRGYGQTDFNLRNATLGESLVSADWTTLRSVVERCINHQGNPLGILSSLPPASELELSDLVKAHDGITDPYNLPLCIQTIDNSAYRFNVSAYQFVTAASVVRATSWVNQIELVITASWSSENFARYFWNAGGRLRLDLFHTAGSPQDNAWVAILDSYVGVFQMQPFTSTRTGSRGTINPIGYWDLTGGYQTIYNGQNIGDGAYSTNDVTIEALRTGTVGTNGGNGSVVQFRITLSDQHTSGFSDIVSAGTGVVPTAYRGTVLTTGYYPTWANTGWIGS
ncbi:MAG: hypothetical protein HC836_10830 [Richelia sp. RM2_1_2]|nr:hypothetical protein [Richelia sp. RM2_1_2]